MTGLLVLTSAILGLVNNRHIQRASIFSFLISILLIILGQLGIIDKCGPIEQVANEIISNYLGMPIVELQRIEGASQDGRR
jgi:UDP-N-acetylmuramyl pentapeptide phosphotransferase/UDP-N-acetylglucosamine-1-phosphate transferase